MIAIIDYDMGNLRSVAKAFEKAGAASVITRDAGVIGNASHMVLPGVGAFKDCMRNLMDYGLVEPIKKHIDAGKPFLGICLGMQLLFEEGTEHGTHKGLGIIKGRVERFPFAGKPSALKVPHIGWNDVSIKKPAPLLEGIPDGTYFYFVHSYYCAPAEEDVALTMTDYGGVFTSSVWRDNVFACQFHPEKSQRAGLRVLKNFSEL